MLVARHVARRVHCACALRMHCCECLMPHASCLITGEDGMARDYVLQGGDGVISVTANVAPCAVAKVMAA